jgi:hypothetical protein
MQLPLVWTLNWLSAVSWFAYHMDDLALATANHDGITDKLLRLISIYIFPWSSTCERQRSLGHLGPILVLLFANCHLPSGMYVYSSDVLFSL